MSTCLYLCKIRNEVERNWHSKQEQREGAGEGGGSVRGAGDMSNWRSSANKAICIQNMNAREATVTTTLSLSSKPPPPPLLLVALSSLGSLPSPVQNSFYAVANNFVLIFFISLAVSEFPSSDF